MERVLMAYAFSLGRDTAEWVHKHRHSLELANIPDFDREALARHYGRIDAAIEAAYRSGYAEGMAGTRGVQYAAALLGGRMN